ncbi:MAG: redoxin domain-containing protein, partial [Terriglobales bacterium]
FEILGYHLAALAVDPPQRAAALRGRLHLQFPLLCDPERSVVTAWKLYNPRERGGIAVPATVVIGSDGRIQHMEREAMASRLRAVDLLAWLREPQAAPRRRGIWPSWRDWCRALQLPFPR